MYDNATIEEWVCREMLDEKLTKDILKRFQDSPKEKYDVNTFLPYHSFRESAEILDRARLGKQRLEVYQILRTLFGLTHGWKNHPCTKMWKGYENALCLYGIACCEEWSRRGYKDNTGPLIREFMTTDITVMPPFLGNEAFHASHRSNLKRKDPIHYAAFTEPDTYGKSNEH
jgi:hypothetical protein